MGDGGPKAESWVNKLLGWLQLMLTISRNLELENGEEFNGKEAPPPGNNSKPTFLQRFTVDKLCLINF